jgi:hypothetical protein
MFTKAEGEKIIRINITTIECPECSEEIELDRVYSPPSVIEPMWKAQHDITELLTEIKAVIEKYQAHNRILHESNRIDAEADQTIERIEKWLHDHRSDN